MQPGTPTPTLRALRCAAPRPCRACAGLLARLLGLRCGTQLSQPFPKAGSCSQIVPPHCTLPLLTQPRPPHRSGCTRSLGSRNRRACRRSSPSLGERYAPKFPLFQKVEVNGEDQHPIFKWLKEQAPPAEGKRGTVQACTAPGTAGADGNRRPSAGLHGFRHGRRQRQQVVKHRRAGCSTCTWAASRALQAPAWPVCRAGPHACAPRHCPPVCTRTISCRAGAGGRHCLELRGEGRLAGGAGPLALALRALIGRPQAFDAAHPCARP